ncbi:orotate phosphoribosyltransferase [Pichia californica]|uniref:orotate phosphoribosyltransferase n=1 Tax=Pichia californica TaxID=460514 RepID=A0A9P6WNH4_9ASCO|nr:orotate phosphoribosyltransferase [[Candida] californica]KAG0690191.1 orotate phosphoribosyltransferase [[Candida] californica]
MSAFKQNFLQAALDAQALKFGTFTLKSGRISPYFFNMGLFNTAKTLSALAESYAKAIIESGIEFDILFGPAYKGIPLAAITVTKLYEIGGEKYANIGYSFNRKEKKDHGEGGSIVGCPLKDKKVLIIDDVMTAGTAINEAFGIIKDEGGITVACIIAVDRMETTKDSNECATKIVSKRYGVPVLSIVSFDDIIEVLKSQLTTEQMESVLEYRKKYVPTN